MTSYACSEVHHGSQLWSLLHITPASSNQAMPSLLRVRHCSIKQGSTPKLLQPSPCSVNAHLPIPQGPTGKSPSNSLAATTSLPFFEPLLQLDFTSHRLACNWHPVVSGYCFSSVVFNTGSESAGELLKETENVLKY